MTGAPWKLPCHWCSFFIEVNARGMRGADPGAGVEAANLMADHVEHAHHLAWSDWLTADNAVDFEPYTEQRPREAP